MRTIKSSLALVLLSSCLPLLTAQAQADGCTSVKGTYSCDWQAFRARFAQAHTVGIEPKPMERFVERRLTELTTSLGKSVAAPETVPDIVFRVIPATDTGIAVGPADQPLARLEVLVPGVAGNPATPLWVETYVGQADKPWPSIVTATADQFEARFHHQGR